MLGRETLVAELEQRRQLGQRVAFTNGCFDLLHAGHVQYLTEAREQADILVVGVNSDTSVRALKGTGRPINPLDDRALVLSALEAVDYLTVFDESTPLELIRAVRPDVLVKGVESYGGRVHLAQLRRPGGDTQSYSTTRLLRQLGAA
jgi:D-beta-D-heptose 7-phosphate kinase/D-beta-D-heptose 1-phosphate adenosyltransferase